jgi:hypothetical protein
LGSQKTKAFDGDGLSAAGASGRDRFIRQPDCDQKFPPCAFLDRLYHRDKPFPSEYGNVISFYKFGLPFLEKALDARILNRFK